MAKRLTQLDKAIQNLNAEIVTLQLARQRLIEQQQRTAAATPPKRQPRVVEKIG